MIGLDLRQQAPPCKLQLFVANPKNVVQIARSKQSRSGRASQQGQDLVLKRAPRHDTARQHSQRPFTARAIEAVAELCDVLSKEISHDLASLVVVAFTIVQVVALDKV